MNQLSLQYISQKGLIPNVLKNSDNNTSYEKIIQFGTGVLLRGLPDFFIDKANKKGDFEGKIIVVKSTDSGGVAEFDQQDNLYTLCVRGIEKGKIIQENIICSAISRVISANSQWKMVLDCAKNPDLQIVISNTTEAGIKFVPEKINQNPPNSFPAKLLAFLYTRYQVFAGDSDKGMIILPTELISENGKQLLDIILQLIDYNGLENDFKNWIIKHNHFCNSLVDRIVPGKPKGNNYDKMIEELGYRDDLLVLTEPYRLWAIEGDDFIKKNLAFLQAGEGVFIESDITLFKELKIRMLNGTHTLACGLAHLAGFHTVREAMEDEMMHIFIKNLMLKDIAQGIPHSIEETQILQFGNKVLDRFRNPFMEHFWLNITLEYSSKMLMRNIPTLINYCKKHNEAPDFFALGFAAYILFMKSTKEEKGVFYGLSNEEYYPIKDSKILIFNDLWKNNSIDSMAEEVLKSVELWGEDLSHLDKFAEKVNYYLYQMIEWGAKATLTKFLKNQKHSN